MHMGNFACGLLTAPSRTIPIHLPMPCQNCAVRSAKDSNLTNNLLRQKKSNAFFLPSPPPPPTGSSQRKLMTDLSRQNDNQRTYEAAEVRLECVPRPLQGELGAFAASTQSGVEVFDQKNCDGYYHIH